MALDCARSCYLVWDMGKVKNNKAYMITEKNKINNIL